MSEKKEPTTGGLDELESALTELLGQQTEGLRLLKETQVMQHALFAQEARRLERKLGSDHPRVERLRTRRDLSLQLVQGLHAELETASIRVPEVEDEAVLIQGRVRDETQRGVAGLEVVVEDEEGKPIRALGAARTNASGYYALAVDPGTAEKLADKEAFLTIRTPTGAVYHRATEPLSLVKGARVYREMSLRRARIHPSQPSPAPPEGDRWVVRGRVHDESGEPLAGLMVTLFDQDRRYDDVLGAALTDAEGEFEITYGTREFREGEEPGPDLYLTVQNVEGETLYTSADAVRYDADRVAEFEVTIERERE